jgi:hypothetical protein
MNSRWQVAVLIERRDHCHFAIRLIPTNSVAEQCLGRPAYLGRLGRGYADR